MPLTQERFSQLRWFQNLVFVVALIGAGILIVLGLTGYGGSSGVWMVAAGGFVLFAGAVKSDA